MTKIFSGSMVMNIILIMIILSVIIFTIVSSIMGRKAQFIEREKRKKHVKDKIKQYVKYTYNRKNLRIEYEKVFPKKGKEFKYRDIFDVIVNIYEAKSNYFLEQKAFEIEGVSNKINKKEYETIWIVNKEIDLKEVKMRIEINDKKNKLTRKEKKDIKISAKKEYKINKKKNIKNNEKEKKIWKFGKSSSIYNRPKPEKFIPRK